MERALYTCDGAFQMYGCGDGICASHMFENKDWCPSDCSHSWIQSFNHHVICDSVMKVHTPNSENEMQAIVKDAIDANKRVKVVGNVIKHFLLVFFLKTV